MIRLESALILLLMMGLAIPGLDLRQKITVRASHTVKKISKAVSQA